MMDKLGLELSSTDEHLTKAYDDVKSSVNTFYKVCSKLKEFYRDAEREFKVTVDNEIKKGEYKQTALTLVKDLSLLEKFAKSRIVNLSKYQSFVSKDQTIFTTTYTNIKQIILSISNNLASFDKMKNNSFEEILLYKSKLTIIQKQVTKLNKFINIFNQKMDVFNIFINNLILGLINIPESKLKIMEFENDIYTINQIINRNSVEEYENINNYIIDQFQNVKMEPVPITDAFTILQDNSHTLIPQKTNVNPQQNLVFGMETERNNVKRKYVRSNNNNVQSNFKNFSIHFIQEILNRVNNFNSKYNELYTQDINSKRLTINMAIRYIHMIDNFSINQFDDNGITLFENQRLLIAINSFGLTAYCSKDGVGLDQTIGFNDWVSVFSTPNISLKMYEINPVDGDDLAELMCIAYIVKNRRISDYNQMNIFDAHDVIYESILGNTFYNTGSPEPRKNQARTSTVNVSSYEEFNKALSDFMESGPSQSSSSGDSGNIATHIRSYNPNNNIVQDTTTENDDDDEDEDFDDANSDDSTATLDPRKKRGRRSKY